jgi:hypothetical protein
MGPNRALKHIPVPPHEARLDATLAAELTDIILGVSRDLGSFLRRDIYLVSYF